MSRIRIRVKTIIAAGLIGALSVMVVAPAATAAKAPTSKAILKAHPLTPGPFDVGDSTFVRPPGPPPRSRWAYDVPRRYSSGIW